MDCNFSSVQGTLKVPPSKSYTQRALVGAMLHSGTTHIFGGGNSDDEQAVLGIVRQQTQWTQAAQEWCISANGRHQFSGTFFCGESGLAARLLGPVAALSREAVILQGSGSLQSRPMDFFDKVLPQLGVSVQHLSPTAGLPLRIQGPLIPQNISVDGSLSSQFISGLLFAFAFGSREKVSIQVNHATSTPYLDMSCAVLEQFGKQIIRSGHNLFEIDPEKNRPTGTVNIEIESDWSSAAFWICAAAINGAICLEGLQEHSLQADRHILSVLKQVGAPYAFSTSGLSIRSGEQRAFETELSHCPDLFPVLAVLAAGCSGVSRLTGLHRLRHKESDRAAAIVSLLQQLSVPFQVNDDTLTIEGGNPCPNEYLQVPPDHRMVMAATLAALYAPHSIRIAHADAVAKSYPEFFRDLEKLASRKK